MKRSKLLIAFSVVIIVIVGIVFTMSRKPAAGVGVIRFGAVLPMTGSYALIGEGEQKGLSLAVQELNSSQDKYQFELQVEDSKGTAADGVNGAQRLLDMEGIDFMFTSLTSVSQAISPMVKERNALLVIYGMDESMADASQGILRIYPGIREEGRQILDVVDGIPSKKIALLTFQQAAIDSQVDEVLIPGLNAKGKDVLAERFQAVDNASLKGIISKIRNFVPDVLVVNAYYSQLPAVLRSIREGGFSGDTPIVGGLNLAIALRSENLSPEMTKGLFLAIPKYVYNADSEGDSASKAFEKLYYATYHGDATYDSAYAYDACMLLGQSILSVGSSPADALAEVLKRRDYEGAVGTLHLDEKGSSVSDWLSVKFENQRFIQQDR